MFNCNLPPALLAEWPGSFTRYCGNTGVKQILKSASAQKVDPGEENSPAAPAGTRTRDLITRLALASYFKLFMAMWLNQPTSEYASTTCYCSNVRVERILKQGSAQRVDPGAENSTTTPVSHLSSALTTEPFLALIILQTLHGHMVEAIY